MNKTIYITLNKSSAQMELEELCSLLMSSNKVYTIALIGYLNGLWLTSNGMNQVWNDLYNMVKHAGKRIHFFIDQQTANEMRKDARTALLMNQQNVVIHIVGDWKKWSPGELGMKFDAIIANPPYCAGLHLKILQDLMPLSDNIVCIHPASWLQFPTRQRPAFMNGRIDDFQIIDRKEANEMFDIDGGDIVISTFVKDGLSFKGSPVTDPQFCCFKFNSRFDF